MHIPDPNIINVPNWNEVVVEVKFAPDNTALAVAYANETIRVFSWPECTEIARHTRPEAHRQWAVRNSPRSLAWSSTPMHLLAICRETENSPMRTVKKMFPEERWYTKWRRTSSDVYRNHAIEHIAVNRWATRMAIVHGRGHDLAYIALTKSGAKTIDEINIGGAIHFMDMIPDRQAALVCIENELYTWMPHDEELTSLHAAKSKIMHATCSPAWIAAVAGHGEVFLHNRITKASFGTHLAINNERPELLGCALSPDGTLLAVNGPHMIALLDVETLEVVAQHARADQPNMATFRRIHFSPCGRYLATGACNIFDFGAPNLGRTHPDILMFA